MHDAGPSLDDGWRRWIAHNHLRGCSWESMRNRMLGDGWAPESAHRALRCVADDPIMQVAARCAAHRAKLESVLANQQAVWQIAPDYDIVQRRRGLGLEQFLKEHCAASRPVVITDLCHDWPARERWHPSELIRRFGPCNVEIQSGRSRDPLFELNKLQLRRTLRFSDFMSTLLSGATGNDEYLTANNCAFSNPDFASLQEDVGAMPPYLDRTQLSGAAHWWIGVRGTSTPLHHDTVMLFHAQIIGSKRWRLISPLETPRLYNEHSVFSGVDLDDLDLDRFPLMAGVRILDVVVEPGEAIFVPLGWWHQVDTLETSVSLSFSNVRAPNRFFYADPLPP